MENSQPDGPTVEELVTKALAAEVIDQECAEDLRNTGSLAMALGMFYTYVIEKGDDPEDLLAECCGVFRFILFHGSHSEELE